MDDRQLTDWRRRNIGFVFQSFRLLPTLSAAENIELMLRISGFSRQERWERTSACLELVGLSKWSGHRPYELSGGQNQRVAIARAIANRPELILADEATGELDTETSHEILSLLRRLVDQGGMTLLMVTHDNLVDAYAHAILHLRDGRIVPPDQL